jgi:hypothetical protein
VPSDSEVELEPEIEALTIYVSQSVGEAGLRLRKTPSMGGALVAVIKAGTTLTVLEPADKARAKIGKAGKWIHVSDPKRRQGHVAANYVELEATPTAETPEASSSAPLTSEPVSEVEAETPVPSGNEVAPETETFTVYVTSAAVAGLRMRSEPNTQSDTLMILPAGSELKVLQGTDKMIGVYGKWLKVREGNGGEGYVAAWYVRK